VMISTASVVVRFFFAIVTAPLASYRCPTLSAKGDASAAASPVQKQSQAPTENRGAQCSV
jgi:hypothetical protein